MSIRSALIKVAPGIEPFVDEYACQMGAANINTTTRMACFLGQCYVESGGFKFTRESLNYAADSEMMHKFIDWCRISKWEAGRYGRTVGHAADQKSLANILYGGKWGEKYLGNILPNDGWDFRGGGHKQLTGRDNYTRFSKEYFGDLRLVDHPELIEKPEAAVASAVWFWKSNNLNKIADTDSVAAVTRKVNGGEVGLAARIEWTDKFLSALSQEK